MKALVTADLHLNINSRFEDSKAILNQIATLAGQEGVDEVWILGDVYDKKRPYNSERVLFHQFVRCLAILDMKVIIISGNHDTDQFNVSALDEFKVLELDMVSLLPNPSVIDFGGFSIYLGHHLVNGAKLGKGDYVAREALNIETILKTKADLYLLGDVHKAQKLHTNPDVLYVGSPERVSFSEREELKGVVIVETSPEDINPRYTFYPLNPRPMYQYEFTGYEYSFHKIPNLEDAIVKVVFNCTKEDYKKINESNIREELKSSYSIKFEYNILKEERKRESNISEGTVPINAFIKYADSLSLDNETIKLGKAIIKKVGV